MTLFVLLPPLLGMHARSGATWDLSKLQFVAGGATFCIALGLAVAAQFALRKTDEAETAVRDRGGQGSATIGYSAQA
jgi:hypothetical protein